MPYRQQIAIFYWPKKHLNTLRGISEQIVPGITAKKIICIGSTTFILPMSGFFQVLPDSTGDARFDKKVMKGYEYWKGTFFLPDGTPRYYNSKTLPLDIQCSSQAIDTLVFFHDRDPEIFRLRWGCELDHQDMQDKTGYFYYRRYSPWLVNKTPTLHWGQATMLCALAGLYKKLQENPGDIEDGKSLGDAANS